MCEKCRELDAKIERFQRMSMMLTDKQTLDGIQLLVETYEAEKRALHPDPR